MTIDRLCPVTTNDYRTQFQRLCRQTFKPSSSAAQTKPKGFKPSKKNRSNRAIFRFFLAHMQKKAYLCSKIEN